MLLSSSGLIWCSLTRSFQLTSEMFSRFIAGSDSFVPMDTETLSEWVNSLCAPIISLAGLVASALEGQTDVRDPAKNHVSAPSTDLEHDLSMAKPLQVSEPLTSTAKRRTRASDIMMIMQVSAAMHTRTEGKAADMSKAQMKIASLKSLPPISLTGEPKAAATHKSRLSTHLRTKSLHVEAKSKRRPKRHGSDRSLTKDFTAQLSGTATASPEFTRLDRSIMEEHNRIVADYAAAEASAAAAASKQHVSRSFIDPRLKAVARSHLSELRHSHSDGTFYTALAAERNKSWI